MLHRLKEEASCSAERDVIPTALRELRTAERLATQWIEREREQRHPGGWGTSESEATKRCRLDLQQAFELVRPPPP